MMQRASRVTVLTLLCVILLLLILEGGSGYGERSPRWWFTRSGAYSAAAASSPLSGTRESFPWSRNKGTVNITGYRNIPTKYDVYNNKDLTQLLDVGACLDRAHDTPGSISYVPPLDGTIPSQTACRDVYGMRFVLFDLQLVNLAEIDAISGSFTAQLQLVFHWQEGWEMTEEDYSANPSFFVYTGDDIKTADEESTCSFVCDTTSTVKRCCDGMWVPQLQLPSCKVNDVESVMPPPYLRTPLGSNIASFWGDGGSNADNDIYLRYSTRRTWYVGLDITCPFTPDFHHFPFDFQFLTIDIINPYASRTWFQLNKGFLEANIIHSIADIDLSPDTKIDGWTITDFIVSSACGTQQTWKPTFLSQDYLLELLGVGYTRQYQSIHDTLNNLTCAEIINLNLEQETDGSSFSNPTDKQPYNQTQIDYKERLNATIAKYMGCIRKSKVPFQWNISMTNESNIPQDIRQFSVDNFNVERSFNFLDFEFQQDPIYGIDFQCVIEAIANLTMPGIQINIITQRYKKYYFVKLFSPTCACVAFTFLAFGLKAEDMLGRFTVIIPSAIALSTLQGFVVSTDIPAIAYTAPTTWIVLTSYVVQLVIAFETIVIKLIYSTMKKANEESGITISSTPTDNFFKWIWMKYERKMRSCSTRRLKAIDLILGLVILLLYIGVIVFFVCYSSWKSYNSMIIREPKGYKSLWVGKDKM